MNAKKTSPEHSELLKVLVIDDERLSSHNLGIQLKFVGEVPLLCSSEQWSDVASAQGADLLLAVVVGAIRKSDPAALLASVHRQLPALGILLVTNQSQPDLSMLPPAGRSGVQVLEESSLNYETMSAALRKAREQKGVAPRVLTSKIISNTGSALFRSLSGKSRAMQQIRQQLQQVAARDVTVLVLGESGTGKEVVARNLHYHSGRGESPFIAVNCATIAPDRYGVELFGQAGGAPGLLERADGGTLYLDEIAELPQNIQTLLLRFLEDKCFHRSGGSELLQANVRVVAGTAQHLQSRIQQGLFRPDLYYRLSLMPIELPPLRQRLSDIPELVQELLRNLESRGYTPISLNAAAIEALQHHKWPGNVRELANLVERLCIMHSEGVIGVNDLPFEYQHTGDTDALLQEIEALTSKVEEKVAVSRASAHPAPAESVTARATAGQPAQAEPAPTAVPAAPVKTRPVLADQPSALLPLNDALLQQYLDHFEKQLVLSALDDCANILSFAAERLSIGEQELARKMQTHGLESF
jgi:sigma-54 specific flagellar transcriptional regulator A